MLFHKIYWKSYWCRRGIGCKHPRLSVNSPSLWKFDLRRSRDSFLGIWFPWWEEALRCNSSSNLQSHSLYTIPPVLFTSLGQFSRMISRAASSVSSLAGPLYTQFCLKPFSSRLHSPYQMQCPELSAAAAACGVDTRFHQCCQKNTHYSTVDQTHRCGVALGVASISTIK